jgi:sortase B
MARRSTSAPDIRGIVTMIWRGRKKNEVSDEPQTDGKRRGGTQKRSAPIGALRRAAMIVCVCVMLVSGYMLANYLVESKSAGDVYKDIEQIYITPPTADAPSPTPTPTPAESQAPLAPSVPRPAPPGDAEPDDTPPSVSYVDEPAPDYWPNVDFNGLLGVNEDFAAWLICAGTNINYPVVRGDDNDYYLKRLFNRAQNSAGTLFIDYRNEKDFSNRNTVIYGHNMRNHSMFWTLTRYKSQSYFDAHPTMRLLTPGGNYEIYIFAGFVAGVDGDMWRVYFTSDEDYVNWLETIRRHSAFSSDVELSAEDRVVTLSTCDYQFDNARYVLYGKLTPAPG